MKSLTIYDKSKTELLMNTFVLSSVGIISSVLYV